MRWNSGQTTACIVMGALQRFSRVLLLYVLIVAVLILMWREMTAHNPEISSNSVKYLPCGGIGIGEHPCRAEARE